MTQIFFGKAAKALCVVSAVVALTGCDLSKNHTNIDRTGNAEFQDYRDAMASRMPEIDERGGPIEEGIPSLQPYVADPGDNLKTMPLVSISVNQTVPLRDVLFELADQAEYDIELDPRIRGSIIFTARNKPFDAVIAKIADISGLRYKFSDDSLRVELDTPYAETYKINYLSYTRQNTSSVRNNVAVVTGDGADTGSQFEVTATSESDFWGELEANLEGILGASSNTGTMTTSRDPRITAVAENPAPVAPVSGVETPPAATAAATPAADGGITAEQAVEGSAAATASAGDTAVPPPPEASPETVLRVDSLPTDEEDDRSQSSETGETSESRFSINRQAGIITVFAPERIHKQVAQYLKDIEKSVSAQVLIEAKVLEVTLTDEFSTGIDWSTFGLLSGDFDVNLDSPDLGLDTAFNIAYVGNEFTTAIEAISQYGTIKALSSPRMTVLNNQSAVLGVATNRVYFDLDIDVTTDEGVTQTEIDSNIRNVPEGVLINVLPSIDLDNQIVTMAIRPTITRTEGEGVEDPAIGFLLRSNDIDDLEVPPVPEVNVQEFDSVLKLRSGEAIVMGGLIQDRSTSNQTGIPVLSEIPVLGAAFRNHADSITKTELVVFLKATILDGSNVHNTDKDLYRTFSHDRRPLDF